MAAARRALHREHDRFPLFADEVAAAQLTPEKRITEADHQLLEYDQAFRDLAAKHWRWGRQQLAAVSRDVRLEILELWNQSSIPPEAHYFADFVRRQLRARGLPLSEE